MSKSVSVTTSHNHVMLLPECIHETLGGINDLCRTFRKSCEGAERAVAGIDEVATLMLQKQRDALLIELDRQPVTIEHDA